MWQAWLLALRAACLRLSGAAAHLVPSLYNFAGVSVCYSAPSAISLCTLAHLDTWFALVLAELLSLLILFLERAGYPRLPKRTSCNGRKQWEEVLWPAWSRCSLLQPVRTWSCR